MRTMLLTVVAAGLLWGGATAHAQSLDGLSCTGELEVIRTDDSLSVLCSGDLEIGVDFAMPEGRLSFAAAGQVGLNGRLNAPSVELMAGPFPDGHAQGTMQTPPGSVISVIGLGDPSTFRYPAGGAVVFLGSGGINLGADYNPPSVLTVSSVPEPQTYALWLAGLAAVARLAAARRRNRW